MEPVEDTYFLVSAVLILIIMEDTHGAILY